MIETTLNANLSVIGLNGKIDQMSKDMVEGFDMVYERIDDKIDETKVEMNKKFAATDKRIVEKVGQVDRKVDEVKVEMNKRFDRVETDMDLIKKYLLSMSEDVSSIKKHFGIKNATMSA